MPAVPQLSFIYPTDNSTFVTAGTFVQLQQNLVNFVNGFLPLTGGTLLGPVSWSAGQTFSSSGVTVGNPAYKHSGIWRTLDDHINDGSIHRVVGPPQIHSASHELGGSDQLYGDQVAISATTPTVTVKQYVDTQVAASTGAVATNYAPSTYYAIGGNDPLYSTSISVNAASASTSIKTYVDGQIANLQIAGGSNPTFNSVTVSTGTINFSNNTPAISSAGALVLSGDGVNTLVTTVDSNGLVKFGNQGNSSAYGTISSTGYSIGSTNIGPTSGVINGPLTSNYDLQTNRSSGGQGNQGAIQFGASVSGAYVSYNIDAANTFFVSQPLTVNGGLSVAAGNTFSVNNIINIGSTPTVTSLPSIRSYSGSLYLNATNSNSILLGSDNVTLSTIGLGPNSNWATFDVNGLHLGSSVVSGSGASITGPISSAGYLQSLSSTLLLGASGSGLQIDYGVSTNSALTISVAGSAISKLQVDGTTVTGSSSYGPLGARVNGSIIAQKNVAAGPGIAFGGAGGFTFTGTTNSDTGLFSTGGSDLRLVTGGTSALAFQNAGSLASFSGSVNVAQAITTNSLTASGNATFNGNLVVNGILYAGTSAIQKFRVKNIINLGFNASTTSTATTYPNIAVPGFVGAQIEAIRLGAITADGTSTQSTFSIFKNGQLIGTIALPNGSTTALAYPINGTEPIQAGDQLHATCTQAGTSTGVTVELEMSQFLF